MTQPTPNRNAAPKLDPREEHFRIPSPRRGLELFLRRLAANPLPERPLPASPLPALRPSGEERHVMLYVHGATFPSALSIAHRFDGRSWRDSLTEAGLDVWGLDFHGFGFSDPYPEMAEPADRHSPLCRAQDASEQLAAALRFILDHEAVPRLSLVAHSWGSMPAGLVAAAHAASVDRLVLFAPIARRPPRRYETPPAVPAWRIVSVQDQWNRFVEDVPAGEGPVLSPRHFEEWAKLYLDSDPLSRERDTAGVKIPGGPFSDIVRAWHGELAYDPALVTAPVAIIRGSWDGLIPDEDARWLFDAFKASPSRRDVKIGGATHLMHLEARRGALYAESIAFLRGGDLAPVPV